MNPVGHPADENLQSWQGGLTGGSRYAGPGTAYFHRVQSADGVVSMDVPADWQAGSSIAGTFRAYSPRGESFSCGKADIFLNYPSMEVTAQTLRMLGTSRQELALLSRLASPPLDPENIVLRLLPQIAGGAMQNLRILGSWPLPEGGTLIYYRYMLLPQRDALFRSLLAPALWAYGQVAMQAEVRLYRVPGMPVGVARIWSFLYQIVEAPQDLFVSNAGAYQRIFESFAVDVNEIERMLAASQQAGAAVSSAITARNSTIQNWSQDYLHRQYDQLRQCQHRNAKMGPVWIDMAAHQSRYMDPNDPMREGTTN